MALEIGEQCRNRWRSLLPMVGVHENFLTGRQGPCPMCIGKDRFRFDDKDGRGTFFCNSCGAGDGVQLVMMANGWTFQSTAEHLRNFVGDSVQDKPKLAMTAEERQSMLRDLWRKSEPIRGRDEAAQYLASRGHVGPIPEALRYVAACPIKGEEMKALPAMIAMVRDDAGKPCNIHRTYLQGGRRAAISSPRKLMPGPVGNIHLAPLAEHLGIAEGIETALAVTRQFQVPCWSVVSTTGMKQFVVPKGVKKLTIFGDCDTKYAGQAAAFHLAHRLSCAVDPIEVAVKLPEQLGKDWAD